MSAKRMNVGAEVRKQISFVLSSCRLYDEGRHDEALRVAVAARVLFHNTANSKGIIGGHASGNGVRMLSTTMFDSRAPFDSSHPLGFLGLCPSLMGFRPCLDDGARREQVDWRRWWSDEPIMALRPNRESVTRRQLVLASANKDGGAHVDEEKPSEYERLDDGLGMEVVVRFEGKTEDEQVKLRHANLAALRQIGHEILLSRDLIALARS